MALEGGRTRGGQQSYVYSLVICLVMVSWGAVGLIRSALVVAPFDDRHAGASPIGSGD